MPRNPASSATALLTAVLGGPASAQHFEFGPGSLSPIRSTPRVTCAKSGCILSSIASALLASRILGGDWSDVAAAVLMGALGGLMLAGGAVLVADEIHNGFPGLRGIDRTSVVKS